MLDLTPSWFTDKPETQDRLGSRQRMRGPARGPADTTTAPTATQAAMQPNAEKNDAYDTEAFFPGLGG